MPARTRWRPVVVGRSAGGVVPSPRPCRRRARARTTGLRAGRGRGHGLLRARRDRAGAGLPRRASATSSSPASRSSSVTLAPARARAGRAGCDELLERLGARPAPRGRCAAGAGISLLLALLALPTGLWWRTSARSTSASRPRASADWLADRARAAGDRGRLRRDRGAGARRRCSAGCRGAGGCPAPGVVVVYAVATTWLAPVVLAPLFNDFEELPDGPLRERVLELADRAGVEVGEVYASTPRRRSTDAQRLRRRDRLDQARRPLRQPDRRRRPGRAASRSSPMSSATSPHDDIPRGIALRRDRRAARDARRRAGRRRRWRRRGGAEPGTPAALPAYALPSRWSPSRSASPARPALAQGRGAGRRVSRWS